MNNNKLTQQTIDFMASNFQLVKFEVLNINTKNQNIGTNDFRIEVLVGNRIIRIDFNYHSKIKSLSVLLSEYECEVAKCPISPASLVALSKIAGRFDFSYGVDGQP